MQKSKCALIYKLYINKDSDTMCEIMKNTIVYTVLLPMHECVNVFSLCVCVLCVCVSQTAGKRDAVGTGEGVARQQVGVAAGPGV